MSEPAIAESPEAAVEPPPKEPWWVQHYTFTGTAVGLVFLWFSMTPSLLPRGPLFQGLVSGVSGGHNDLRTFFCLGDGSDFEVFL